MIKVSIVFPAYNEAGRGNLVRVLDKYVDFFKKQFGMHYQIIVVNDGSTDNTLNVVEEYIFKNKSNNVELVSYSVNKGKGGAILEGLKVAKGDVVGFVDVDDSFNISEIFRMIAILDASSYDALIASKWKGRSFFEVTEPFTRKFLSRVWNLMVRTFLGLSFNDTQAGAKFVKKNVLERLDLNAFICKDFSFDLEFLYRLKKKGFWIEEVYVPTVHVEQSTFKLKHTLKMFKSFLRLWLSK